MGNSNNLIHSFNHTEHVEGNFKGLTKREYFAAIAMQGILANELLMKAGIDIHIKGERELSAYVTGMAIEYADALLNQLEKK